MDNTRLRYLQAMNIPVWLGRDASPAHSGNPEPIVCRTLRIGPGSGATLLVCADAAHSATPLAADLARAVGRAPIWAWPQEGGSDLEGAVQERLLTGIAVFGPELARQLIQGGATAVLGTARIVVLPAMEDLASDPRARRRCWALLREARMAECP